MQLQLVNQELNKLMEKVITPLALLKVVKDFPESDFYKDKSVYEILISSDKGLLEEIR